MHRVIPGGMRRVGDQRCWPAGDALSWIFVLFIQLLDGAPTVVRHNELCGAAFSAVPTGADRLHQNCLKRHPVAQQLRGPSRQASGSLGLRSPADVNLPIALLEQLAGSVDHHRTPSWLRKQTIKTASFSPSSAMRYDAAEQAQESALGVDSKLTDTSRTR